ncbi:MAG: HDOD domain-containing protein [Bacteroidota bacterium]
MEHAIPDYVREAVRSLPPLPTAARRLLELMRDPEADFSEIAQVIGTDPSLTARVLRAANSPFYGLPRRVDTLRQATVLLGSETVANLALSVGVMSLEAGRGTALDLDAFWRHTLAVGTLARQLAQQLHPDEAEAAFVGGLLHDIGLLVMAEHFGTDYEQVLMAAQYGTKPLHELERDFFDLDHAVVGHALCLHWNIPHTVTTAVAEHHNVEAAPLNSAAYFVREANTLVKAAGIGFGGNQYVEVHTSEALPRARIHPQALQALLRTLERDVREIEVALGRGEALLPHASAPPVVHLQITHAAEAELLQTHLQARGYAPVPRQDRASPEADDHIGPVVALVTDLPLSPTQQFAYTRHGAWVLDYAAWRSTHAMPEDGQLRVDLLHHWLGQLPAPHPHQVPV